MTTSRIHRALFTVTICAGSFLLFLVQPMIARMALPRLGGAPSVWNSAMLVYQALLLGGYAYAHWLGRFRARQQAVIHLGLFLLAALTLPIGLITAMPSPTASPALWILWLLVASIGPLFFVVAAQAPMLQNWYALSGGDNPYPLYAASNLGSFAGLLTYPLLVEPLMSVVRQSWLWTAGYGLLFLLVVACARILPRPGDEIRPERAQGADQPPPGWRTIALWIVLPAIPSGLMLSTSLHLTTDIVAMPLLWVLPLGLYLLSFTIAFSEKQGLAEALTFVAPFFLLMGGCCAFIDSTDYPLIVAVVTLLTLFVLSVTLHAKMYALRPAPDRLTGFYLALSVGGVIGGLFCALIAPLVFDWTYEHPLLLLAAGLLLVREPLFERVGRLWSDPARRTIVTAVLLLVGLVASLIGEGVILVPKSDAIKAVCFLLIIAIALLAIGNRALFAGSLLYLMLCLGGWSRLALSTIDGAMTRSYFGVYVVRDNGPTERILAHGTTLHGIQNLTPGMETAATSYYAPDSGVGLALRASKLMFGDHARVGVVGLGAGTLACYVLPGQRWRFYEIDPAVVAIARNPRDFTFLSRCQPHADIAVGDARLVLAKEPAAGADLLVIDAFSSDTVPMHLLTTEAFEVYARHLSREGLLLVHISNRYLDLKPVIAAAAREGGWTAQQRLFVPDRRDQGRHYVTSAWIAMSKDPFTMRFLTNLTGQALWTPVPLRPGFSPWTDDYGSVLPILKL